MRFWKPLEALGLRHVRESWKVILLAGGAAMVPLLAAVAAALTTGLNFSFFTRDPLAVADGAAYLGFVSNLGVMVWTGGALLALFGGHHLHAGTAKGRMLASAGWLALLLAADDMFMLHDIVFAALGLDASVVYGGIALAGIWRYRVVLVRETNFPLFMLAFGGLGMSAGIDAMLHVVGLRSLPGSAFVEDCFKFLGICFWTTYAWREAASVAAPAEAPAPARALDAVAPVGVRDPLADARLAAPGRSTPAPP